MSKVLFVSFSYKDSYDKINFSNGTLDSEEPKSFEDIQELEKKIIEIGKKQNMYLKNVIILNWKVLGEEKVLYKGGVENERRENKKNERAGYFSK